MKMPNRARDYYEVLGVARNCSADEIKSAYRARAREVHPDRNAGDAEAERRLKEVNAAYDALRDPASRRSYDVSTLQGLDIVREDDAFDDFFRAFIETVVQPGRAGAAAHEGVEARLDLSLEEAFFGTIRELRVPHDAPCTSCGGWGGAPGPLAECAACRGTGRISFSRGFVSFLKPCAICCGRGKTSSTSCPICRGRGRTVSETTMHVQFPPGVESGSRFRIGRRGSHAPGEVHVVVHVDKHATFRRDGKDLSCEIAIPFPLAVLGGSIDVPLLEGGAIRTPIHPGTQSGKRFHFPHRGMPAAGRSGRGDLDVTIRVAVPERVTSEQRKLIEELAQTLGGSAAGSEPRHP
jgi:molecular chaperone DnaJ